MDSKVENHRSGRQDNKEEEKLNLYFKVIKTVAMEVKKSETVRDVKAMMKEQEDISECVQQIFFSGDRLQDDKKLVDYGIQQNSTLKIFVQNSAPLRLNIKISPYEKKFIVVEANAYDTIQNVKSLISAKEGINSDSFSLIKAGKTLEGDKTLASLNIHGGESTTLHIVTKPRNMLPISVKMPSGVMVKIEVNLLQKVRDIKTLVESMVGFSVDDMRLTYDGKELEDSEALHRYNFKEEPVLEMSPQPRAFQIFIKPGYGKTTTLDVWGEDLVKNVKDKIVQKLKLPAHVHYLLVFEGKALSDDRNLASYNIQKNSNLISSLRVISDETQ